jgi:hypothetical protein
MDVAQIRAPGGRYGNVHGRGPPQKRGKISSMRSAVSTDGPIVAIC